ncbi:formate dehydrogenase accessory protein FdhE [Paenirhodobacter sp.]|uniref:formate dehydrogenase accessory protein FdhE n=1 Tax=Paenirhodobacter sp. TaxID=1965326 RepID=UPI003B40F5F2
MSLHPIPEARHFDPILRPELRSLYTVREARLRQLAVGHDLSAFLSLAADITAAQRAALAPVSVQGLPAEIVASGAWCAGLDTMLQHLDPIAAISPYLDRLVQMNRENRIRSGTALIEGRFDAVDPALAPFLWAAVSLAVAQSVRGTDFPPKSDEETAWCPICGGHPVASYIHSGDRQGLRYLHCALCECEWHMVRAKCSCCGESGQLDYLSFDTAEAVVRAEACNDCGGYLKVISAERDPEAEVVADDLATLLLDDAAVAEGFGRTGFNPFALPG